MGVVAAYAAAYALRATVGGAGRRVLALQFDIPGFGVRRLDIPGAGLVEKCEDANLGERRVVGRLSRCVRAIFSFKPGCTLWYLWHIT